MDWEQITQAARELVEAHPKLKPWQYAQMLQQQFRDQPMIGWFVLMAMDGKLFRQEQGGGGG